jgi:DNA-binding transcriptional MerR regulator
MPSESTLPVELPPIPAKRYFTIGEVSELCLVKPHVLRYWEQEFTQLRPVKRRGNRRYYQHHEVLLVRRIRELLYGQGFTIIGARGRLDEEAHGVAVQPTTRKRGAAAVTSASVNGAASIGENASNSAALPGAVTLTAEEAHDVRKALLDIATLLQPPLPKK